MFLDFDGTLVELADSPTGSRFPKRLRSGSNSLGERLGGRLALVSGRALDNLEHHLGTLRIASRRIAWRRSALGATARRWAKVRSALPKSAVNAIEQFADRTGARYERKAHGAALHSRGQPEIEEDAARFMEELADRHGLEVKRGKFVAELVQPGADKGAAVRAFMARPPFSGAPPDVRRRRRDRRGRLRRCAGHWAGSPSQSAHARTENADYALADPAAVHQWLEL